MKKEIFALIIIFIFISCSSNEQKIERIREDGCEVVLNHLEPYEIKGESSTLRLEEELCIDLENKEFEDLGLKFPEYLDADSKGNLYVLDKSGGLDFYIYKFSKNGKFEKCFGRKGQGPGEIQFPHIIIVNSHDEIIVSDSRNLKILTFDSQGSLICEVKIKHGLRNVTPLENGHYLATGSFRDTTSEGIGMNLKLFDSNFEEIKELDSFNTSHLLPGRKTPGTIISFYWRAGKDKIFIGNEQRGYEILVYDLDGNLIRKIRKKYIPQDYPEEFKKQIEKYAEQMPNLNLYALKQTPPFNSFFIDDRERLYVMTYKQEENKEEYTHDIFNAEGIFIARKSFGLSFILASSLNPRSVIVRNNRYYRIRYKENGYAELIVYRMIWE